MSGSPEFSLHEVARYSRQLTLDGFGRPGQAALKAARVAVIGAGGLGSPALLYLAACGVGHLTVIDDDAVELSNLHRQVIHTDAAVGVPKARSARREMLARNPEISVEVEETRLTADNAVALLRGADVVLDGTDNFAARYAASHACAVLGIPHVWGSILGFDAQLSVFGAGGPVYEDVFPTPPPPGTVPSCAAGGVLGPLVGVVGAAMAMEAVKLVTGVGTPLRGRIGYYSGLTGEWEYIPVIADPAVADRVTDAATPVDAPVEAPVDAPMEAPDLTGAVLLDVREPDEFAAFHLPDAVNVPLSALSDLGGGIPASVRDLAEAAAGTDRPLVVYCAAGVRSAQAVEILAASGIEGVSLPGGINAWLDAYPAHPPAAPRRR
ncbi:ThiF family adenylyltransferase [Corynebacterium terpenotabidum]|uniref:Molybdopterin biosynthesis protein MoeB n=1 Tax=Corynebacterium terpenotabidum Y-11 TaxID=1200352 RepID=S4XG58_9CORY|nr:ThiF family adenylyltransferase [Corynebacterium terpenotabidum]AGP31559.1 molybdopterin biosynthesis protein MoeB [Corynebacterium terpenotabidum Y-11]